MGENRFTALDSWRGVAACVVALLHLHAFSHAEELALVRNGYLFVDFFFVLSGFVIAANYLERLSGGFSVWRFLLLRLGRLYPLHLAVLGAFIGVDLLRGVWTHVESPVMLAHLLMINGLGVVRTPAWNVPSWSVSTEFFAYAAFALAVMLLRGRIQRLLVAVLILCSAVLYIGVGSLYATGYEIVRCLYGFAAGVAAWYLYLRFRERLPSGTLAEVTAIAGVVLFVGAVGRSAWSLAAPMVFAAVVLVFATERGAISSLLRRKSCVFLGTVSYSIYMVHFFIAQRVLDTVVIGRSLGIPGIEHLGRDKWMGDLVVLLYLAIVVATSALTYRYVESPARALSRRALLSGRPSQTLA